MRIAPPLLTLNSFMLGCRAPTIVSTVGRPRVGPPASSADQGLFAVPPGTRTRNLRIKSPLPAVLPGAGTCADLLFCRLARPSGAVQVAWCAGVWHLDKHLAGTHRSASWSLVRVGGRCAHTDPEIDERVDRRDDASPRDQPFEDASSTAPTRGEVDPGSATAWRVWFTLLTKDMISRTTWRTSWTVML